MGEWQTRHDRPVVDHDPNSIMYFLRARYTESPERASVLTFLDLLDLHKPVHDDGWWCDELETGLDSTWPCLTVRILAAQFKSHPDYRPEWSVPE